MMKPLIVIAAIFAMSAQTFAQGVFVMGAGRMSCAAWLADANSEYEGSTWLLGFWSGKNFALLSQTGSSSDALGIIGAAKLRCEQDPAAPMLKIANQLFDEMAASGN